MENGTSSGDRLGEGNSSAIALDFNETHIVTGAGCGNQSLLWEGSSARGFCSIVRKRIRTRICIG